MRCYVVCLLYLVLAIPAMGQTRVDNVRFEQQGEQVIITYDLIGNESTYSIAVELSTDGGRTFTVTPKTLSGDVGDGVKPGRGKRIVWEAMQDTKGLSGEQCVFRVTAKSWSDGDMAYVPAGWFTMGSEDGEDDEKPVHNV